MTTGSGQDFYISGNEDFETPQRTRHNFTATAAPTPADDSTEHYTVGSLWEFEGRVWMLAITAPGQAIWAELTPDGHYREVMLHPGIASPPEPLHLNGDWLYFEVKD